MYYEIVLAGVAISLLFVELTGLSPAGLIVPGYLALCLQTLGGSSTPWQWLWRPGASPNCWAM